MPEKPPPEATIEIEVVKDMLSGPPNKNNYEINSFHDGIDLPGVG